MKIPYILRQGERLLPSGLERRLASGHSITIREERWYGYAANIAVDHIWSGMSRGTGGILR